MNFWVAFFTFIATCCFEVGAKEFAGYHVEDLPEGAMETSVINIEGEPSAIVNGCVNASMRHHGDLTKKT